MAKLYNLLLSNPVKSLLVLYSFLAQAFIVLLRHALLAPFPQYQSLRIQLQRCYLAACSLHFPDLTHRLPADEVHVTKARFIDKKEFKAYVVPGTVSIRHTFAKDRTLERPGAVIIYAHGGGYARGEAKMYLNYFYRWVAVAAQKGIDIVFVSVEYPLTTEAPHPAQRDAFLAAYNYQLGEGVPPERIIFMGDSAGGGLSLISSTELLRQGLPQPAASVLISPWIDMSLSAYEGGNPLVETDFLVAANQNVPGITKMFLGSRSGSDPEVNPLFSNPDELKGLNPQLILLGGAEFCHQDGRDLAVLCKRAGVKHQLVVEFGQLHVYALGSKWIAPEVREKTDTKIVDWIKAAVS